MTRQEMQRDFEKEKKIINGEIDMFVETKKKQDIPLKLSECINIFRDNINIFDFEFIIRNQFFSKNDRFIFFSKIAKYLYPADMSIALKIRYIAEHATNLDIDYDWRTGHTAGCVYKPSYDFFKCEVSYYDTPTFNFTSDKFPKAKEHEQPYLDCSGFVSWLCYILDIYNGPANELRETKPGSKIYIKRRQSNPGGGGQWNVYSKPFVKPVEDGIGLPGDFIYFPDHIGIVSKCDNFEIQEIVHSAPAHHGQPPGPRIEGKSDWFDWLMNQSRKAVGMVAGHGEVLASAPYLLTRIEK